MEREMEREREGAVKERDNGAEGQPVRVSDGEGFREQAWTSEAFGRAKL